MTELKTLKDLKIYDYQVNKKVDIAELRAEAVKWVKAEKPQLYGKSILDRNYTAEEVRICIKEWIKHFFNLEEEDLK